MCHHNKKATMNKNNLLVDDTSVELLINAGADITIKDDEGKTPRDIAVARGRLIV